MADHQAHLLVADDNKVNRLLLARSLEQQGHAVTLVNDGRAALDALRQGRYDLLLLDIEMPVMDGFQVLEAMKADRALRELPVIVTSSVEGLANIVRCIELGAEDYLPKPLNAVLLKARVNASLEKKRLRDQQQEMVRRFATPEVAQDMQQSGFALGGKRVVATVMFSDIRGFTAMVERQTPEDTIELLNTYYTLMFEAITAEGGVVNQMVGDGLMAIFGAPLPLAGHSAAAARAALDMLGMVAQYNTDREVAGQQPIAIGIGIATGEMVAGYTGTQARATYTCIGDTVNLAARLEAHTKVMGRAILLDGAARKSLGADFAPDAMGSVVFKGKAEATAVYALGPVPAMATAVSNT